MQRVNVCGVLSHKGHLSRPPFPEFGDHWGKGGRKIVRVRGGKDEVTGVFWILLDLCPHELTGAVADFTRPSQATFEKGEERSSGTPSHNEEAMNCWPLGVV